MTVNTSPFDPIDVVILAAGKGTRMRSAVPKVLHTLAGHSLIGRVLDTAAELQARKSVVITGFESNMVQMHVTTFAPSNLPVQFALQEPQLGTGHALQQAMPLLSEDGIVVILSGDVPLIEASTLKKLVSASGNENLALLTIDFGDPAGYGRILREKDTGQVLGIVEHKDANEHQRHIMEVYSGMMAVPAKYLKNWLDALTNNNAQGEYYLTDIVRMAVQDGVPVVGYKIDDPLQVAGVNSPEQLSELEEAFLASR